MLNIKTHNPPIKENLSSNTAETRRNHALLLERLSVQYLTGALPIDDYKEKTKDNGKQINLRRFASKLSK
jgi:hypothetical protein